MKNKIKNRNSARLTVFQLRLEVLLAFDAAVRACDLSVQQRRYYIDEIK
jgi:hypothetical protein